jgi:beta-glucosidase-like glycosyl hydrolase
MAAPLIRSRTPCLFSKSGVVVQAFMNGTDIEGGGVEWRNLSLAIDQGLATEARLDEAVRRSFKPHFDVGLPPRHDFHD